MNRQREYMNKKEKYLHIQSGGRERKIARSVTALTGEAFSSALNSRILLSPLLVCRRALLKRQVVNGIERAVEKRH
jgi:hypothetical protein